MKEDNQYATRQQVDARLNERIVRHLLTDENEMPFGKHKGEKLKNVPAQYLLWLWDNGVWEDKGRPLHNYIKNAFSALEQDAPDYIVKHPIKK